MHKIIALWSHPRSMSTAMERVMRERGDLDCAHEPFMYDYYVNRSVREMPHFDVQDDHPQTYEAIRDMLLARAEDQPVFFKDMSYYVMPHILEDAAFRDRLVNCFLIRNPMASIKSYFKLDPNVSNDEIGIEQQWRHYQALADTGQTPVVIEAEAVRRDDRGTLLAMWDRIGLPFVESAFDWQNERPADWAQVDGWHADAGTSKSIRPLTLKDLTRQEEAFFAAAEVEPKMLAYLEYHMPYYLRLKAAAMWR
ncbi:hypothetical protein [Tropicibacter sp. Alg240-R139]|uniref:sulfotransferase-like domain-containing protein n=1 Tax=Tropicibacter sp. Alg240-R139 TaxID=2305991 RepID=UPI0013DFE720|nr:hypothetical protein [Tropicibacter sp. Alg240-R139]